MGTPITYTLAEFEGETLPSWVSFNEQMSTISGTVPDVNETTTYSFYIEATSAEWTGVEQKLIIIEVVATPEEVEEPEAELEVLSEDQAPTNLQAGAIAGIGASILSSVISGKPPTGMWAIVHQLQFILLLLMVDDYTPEEIDEYIEAQSTAMFSFDFIPFVTLPGFNIPVDWMDFQQPNAKLELLEVESRSTFTNLFSVF